MNILCFLFCFTIVTSPRCVRGPVLGTECSKVGKTSPPGAQPTAWCPPWPRAASVLQCKAGSRSPALRTDLLIPGRSGRPGDCPEGNEGEDKSYLTHGPSKPRGTSSVSSTAPLPTLVWGFCSFPGLLSHLPSSPFSPKPEQPQSLIREAERSQIQEPNCLGSAACFPSHELPVIGGRLRCSMAPLASKGRGTGESTSTGGCDGYAGPGACGSQWVGSWLSLLGTADRRSPCSCLH